MICDPEIDDLLGGSPVELEAAACLDADSITEAELAQFLNVSSSHIRTLAKDGVIKRVARGRYSRQASTRAIIARLQDQVRARRPFTGLESEKHRLVKEQADRAAIRNAQARGELIPAIEVERTWAGILREVRAAMLALPSRIQLRLQHLSAMDLYEIDLEIREALQEASETEKERA